MSGQWEVVGKSKKDKHAGKSKKLSKDEKKKFVDNAPKVEDLLPLSQVRTLYSALDTSKSPPKPVEKAAKTKENEPKKSQKKSKEKKEPVKENKPQKTSLEAAVSLIKVTDVQNVLESGQMQFPEAPLVWLKGLASWLNAKLPVDNMDNVFTAKSFEYPLCLLKADVRSTLKKALKEVPDSAIQMFFDFCLTSMANDMTKGSPVSGYKMFIQLVASQCPAVAVNNLPKSALLRHSYQNRPAIGCSIMWALGQAGFKDICTGLQVWLYVMYPVNELRNYTQFITDYLKQLLARHSTSKAVTIDNYLNIIDAVFTAPSLPKTELRVQIRRLQGIVCNVYSKDQLHTLFEPLLSRLQAKMVNQLRDELLMFIGHCFREDPQTFTVWKKLYTQYLPQSAVLLRNFNSNWSQYLPEKKVLDLLSTFKATNEELMKSKPKTEGLQECTRTCKELLGSMLDIDPDSGLPWKYIFLVLSLAIGGYVAHDVRQHNNFRESNTAVFLNDMGVLEYGEQIWLQIQEVSKYIYRWSEQNVPVYWAQTRAVMGPYMSVLADWVSIMALQVVAIFKLLLQYLADKKPIVEQWLSQYAPGLVENISQWAAQAWNIISTYGLQAGTLALKYLSITYVWLQDNVLVGKLSPENIQRVTLEALNTTQTLAAQTMSWLNSKVITESSKTV